VSLNARQLAEGAQRLAFSTHEQDIRFGPVAEGCDVLHQVVGRNAERCRSAGQITAEVLDKLGDSSRQMGEMTEAMHRISDSSRQISTINKTIEDIAFQTNILALNAAVEAARAGHAGKGFAVVADEVRNLAAKSAEAAQSTTQLVDHSVHMVDNGTGISHATADSLQQAVDISRQISQLIQDIVTTSEEQTEKIAFIHNGIQEISALTAGDSQTAEQNAQASAALSKQAQTLRELVAHFRIQS
jgi:methyl-accepting chemotaxis protein